METKYRDCDADQLLQQLGANLLAVSGGVVLKRKTGVTLPVGNGYAVEIDLNFYDYYDVKRVFYPNNNERVIKGETFDIDAFNIGEVAYRASCFMNLPFGDDDCKKVDTDFIQHIDTEEILDDLFWFKKNKHVLDSAK